MQHMVVCQYAMDCMFVIDPRFNKLYKSSRMDSTGNTDAALEPRFEYVFPAIRGVQAKREFYVSMCPLRLIPRIFVFDGEELIPELRAQRTLNKGRIPQLARYIVQNRNDYTF